jgi:hypothetical protein
MVAECLWELSLVTCCFGELSDAVDGLNNFLMQINGRKGTKLKMNNICNSNYDEEL